jgi:hypothetical protein
MLVIQTASDFGEIGFARFVRGRVASLLGFESINSRLRANSNDVDNTVAQRRTQLVVAPLVRIAPYISSISRHVNLCNCTAPNMRPSNRAVAHIVFAADRLVSTDRGASSIVPASEDATGPFGRNRGAADETSSVAADITPTAARLLPQHVLPRHSQAPPQRHPGRNGRAKW